MVMAVAVTTAPTLAVGRPRRLFEGPFSGRSTGRLYGVLPDGEHFIATRLGVAQAPREIRVVLHWVDDLERRVPVR